jgi:phosphate/sulfate permease
MHHAGANRGQGADRGMSAFRRFTEPRPSRVAGTMAANKSGLQLAIVRNLLLAWSLTLPMAVLLSAVLYYVLVQIF